MCYFGTFFFHKYSRPKPCFNEVILIGGGAENNIGTTKKKAMIAFLQAMLVQLTQSFKCGSMVTRQ